MNLERHPAQVVIMTTLQDALVNISDPMRIPTLDTVTQLFQTIRNLTP